MTEYTLPALADWLASNPDIPRDPELAVTMEVICQTFAVHYSILDPIHALRMIDICGPDKFRIRAPRFAHTGAPFTAPSMRVQFLGTHDTAMLERHNSVYHPDVAQRGFWRADATDEDRSRRCLQLPASLSAHVQTLSDLRSCTCVACCDRTMWLGARPCPPIAAIGTFYQPTHTHDVAVRTLYQEGLFLTAGTDPASKPQAVLIPAQQAVVPPEMANRFDMVVWVNARGMQATMPVTLRCDGAWVTGGTVNSTGHAIIPCQFIVAVELPRDRS